MALETFALINADDQVVNHIVVDKEGADFKSIIADRLVQFNCVRYVETTESTPTIIMHESEVIWTTHQEGANPDNADFVLPDNEILNNVLGIVPPPPVEPDYELVTINGRVYPADSHLIVENADTRPVGWVLPAGEAEVSLSDAE